MIYQLIQFSSNNDILCEKIQLLHYYYDQSIIQSFKHRFDYKRLITTIFDENTLEMNVKGLIWVICFQLFLI